MDFQNILAIAFSEIIGLNDVQRKQLLQVYGSVSQLYHECNKKSNRFLSENEMLKTILTAPWPLKAAEAEIKKMEKYAIGMLSIEDADYPNRLLESKDPPTVIYYKGTKKWNLPKLVSIVGTRQHTAYANRIIHTMIEGLMHLNLGIISGLAHGVDTLVHQKSIELAIPTWGVLAHGLDEIYPIQNTSLAHNMLANGGIISENKIATPPIPYQFPKRNRIVAAMSDATIVVESDLKGGSLITAKLAFAEDRSVFAVPGKITDIKSSGCLALHQMEIAQLYHNPIQFLASMQWPLAAKKEAIDLPVSATETALQAYLVHHGPIHRDELSNLFILNTGELAAALLSLELLGKITQHPGGFYSSC